MASQYERQHQAGHPKENVDARLPRPPRAAAVQWCGLNHQTARWRAEGDVAAGADIFACKRAHRRPLARREHAPRHDAGGSDPSSSPTVFIRSEPADRQVRSHSAQLTSLPGCIVAPLELRTIGEGTTWG